MNIKIATQGMGLPGGSDSKASACNAKDLGSIPGSEQFHGEGKGNPLQYSCPENSTDRGAWRATAHGVTEWGMTKRHTDAHTQGLGRSE